MRLGIDFGTTRTVVVAARDGRHPIVAFDDDGEFREHVPGIAALDADGKLVVGWAAHRLLASGGAVHAVRSIKRAVQTLMPGDDVPGLPGISALELVTTFLRELRTAIVERSNLETDDDVFEVAVAVPANAASRQRWITLEAFRAAGFTPIAMVNEPTAAAIELAHLHLGGAGKRSPRRYVVVYDLGGGTFDTSAVSLEGRSFELIASEGIAELGGDDFDEIVLELACAQLGLAVPTGAHLALARERARAAKESLRPTTKKLLVELGPLGSTQASPGPAGARSTAEAVRSVIDTAALYARCEPLIDRTLAETERLFARLRDAGIDPDDPKGLGGVYLVGGAAAFPAVARRLRAEFGKKLSLAPQPFAATAAGLAIAADPSSEVMVREASTRHIGVWREARGGADKIFDPLIGKALPAPLVVERRYRPTHAVGHLRFVECGALDGNGQPVHDLVPMGDIYFPYDPSLPDDVLAAHAHDRRPDLANTEIRERYTYKPDGTISVEIANMSIGYSRTYQLGAM
jgi:molecular chaperone DnaK (HSP70)